MPRRKQSTATARAPTGGGRPGRRVTGDPDVEDVGRLTGLVRPCPWPPIATARTGRRLRGHQVEPGLNPVLGLEHGRTPPGRARGSAPWSRRGTDPTTRVPSASVTSISNGSAGAMPDAPCRGGSRPARRHRVRWPRRPSPPATRAAGSLAPARPPSTGRWSSAHPGLEHAGGHLPPPQSVSSTGRSDEGSSSASGRRAPRR